jgi:hypothetical protein
LALQQSVERISILSSSSSAMKPWPVVEAGRKLAAVAVGRLPG